MFNNLFSRQSTQPVSGFTTRSQLVTLLEAAGLSLQDIADRAKLKVANLTLEGDELSDEAADLREQARLKENDAFNLFAEADAIADALASIKVPEEEPLPSNGNM